MTLRGLSLPLDLFRAKVERPADSRFEAMHPAGLTPFVGRDEEIALLLGRWGLAKAGEGQVVLLEGEPEIGKSRITNTLREPIAQKPHTRLQYQCSPFSPIRCSSRSSNSSNSQRALSPMMRPRLNSTSQKRC